MERRAMKASKFSTRNIHAGLLALGKLNHRDRQAQNGTVFRCIHASVVKRGKVTTIAVTHK
jgi:hypothetical protein